MIFALYFSGSRVDDNDTYELVKQYNQLIKHKQYLEYLEYDHHRIGTECADTKQEIQELIYQID